MAQVVPLFFVEEKHTIVCQTDFPWRGISAATHQRHLTDGVVWCAVGPCGEQSGARFQTSCHGVDFGGFERFRQAQRRQNGRQSLSHHRLTAARAADKENVVTAGASHLKGAFHIVLSLHTINKIDKWEYG